MLLARQSSLLPFLSSLWGVYEPWRHRPTSAAAIIPSSPKSKDHEDFWNDLKGTAVMWDFTKIECNTIYSRDGISRYRRSPAFRAKCGFFFPSAFELSEISAGKMILAETIHPMREQTESQTNQSQRFIHWSQESFLVSKR